MELLDMTKMSSKGQVVIPDDIRKTLGLSGGTKFIVWTEKDVVVLKKFGRPASDEINKLFSESSKYARCKGIKKSDVKKIISEVKKRRKNRIA